MTAEHIYTGPTVDEAILSALDSLDLKLEEVVVEVIDEPAKKLFGLGGVSEARVKVVPRSDNNVFMVSDNDAVAKEESVAEGNGIEGADIKNDNPADDVSDDDVDAIADAATATIKDIARLCSVENIDVEEYEGDEGELILDVVGDNLGFFIGRHGKTVDALQVVVSAIATKRSGVHYPLVIDVEGYKHRRKQKVVEIALRTAERVARTGKPLSLRPMTAQERRQVHIAIRDLADADTRSEGTGAYRHVVITPVK